MINYRSNPVNTKFKKLIESVPQNEFYIKSECVSDLKRINYILETGTLEVYRQDKSLDLSVELNKANWQYKVVKAMESSFLVDCVNLIWRFCIVFFNEQKQIIDSSDYDYVTIYKLESGPGKGREFRIDLKFISEEILEKILKVPYSSIIHIAVSLDLIQDSDMDKNHKELVEKYVYRADEKGVLKELYVRINTLYETLEIETMVDQMGS